MSLLLLMTSNTKMVWVQNKQSSVETDTHEQMLSISLFFDQSSLSLMESCSWLEVTQSSLKIHKNWFWVTLH